MRFKFFWGKKTNLMSALSEMFDEQEIELGTDWTVYNDASGTGVEIKVTDGEVHYQIESVIDQLGRPRGRRLAAGIWVPLEGRVILRSKDGAKAMIRPLA